MNKKSKITFYLFSLLSAVLVAEIAYLGNSNSMSADTKEKKVLFVSLTGLSDLAFSSNSSYIRHRSLSITSDIYSLDGCLREYDSVTYAIANSKITSSN
ncbi:MAG: hypothetical protein ABFQ64_02735 [Campylobacterota bacterium]